MSFPLSDQLTRIGKGIECTSPKVPESIVVVVVVEDDLGGKCENGKWEEWTSFAFEGEGRELELHLPASVPRRSATSESRASPLLPCSPIQFGAEC